jgi:hypothetical protein
VDKSIIESDRGKLIFATGIIIGVYITEEIKLAISQGAKILLIKKSLLFDKGYPLLRYAETCLYYKNKYKMEGLNALSLV